MWTTVDQNSGIVASFPSISMSFFHTQRYPRFNWVQRLKKRLRSLCVEVFCRLPLVEVVHQPWEIIIRLEGLASYVIEM